MDNVMFTTFDNPWNPFTHWNEWYYWDEFVGRYHTCGALARTLESITDSDRREYGEEVSDDDIANDIFLRDHFFSHKRVTPADYETESDSDTKADDD